MLLAAGIHILILLAYAFSTPVVNLLATPESETHFYIQQEFFVFAELLGSLLPAYVLGRGSSTNPWLIAVVLRLIAFVPAAFLLGNNFVAFFTSRPVSFHVAFITLAGFCAAFTWKKKLQGSN